MRQRYIWLIVGVVTLSLMLTCVLVGVSGYVLMRDYSATLAALHGPTVRELDESNSTGRRFELPEPRETPTPSAAASPRATATAEPTPSASLRASRSPEPSARPSAPPSPSPTPDDDWTVVYEDDFSDPDSGWYTWNEDDLRIDYVDGAYQFVITEQDAGYWETHRSFRLSRLRDVRIEVDATQVDGYVEDTFGIICRYQGDSFYSFDVGHDGWYSIGRFDGEDFTLLAAPPEFEEDDSDDVRDVSMPLQDDEDTLRLRADCIGDTLTLYVNDEKIAEVQDDAYPVGGIGLTAYNYDAPRTEILFDNIVVSKR